MPESPGTRAKRPGKPLGNIGRANFQCPSGRDRRGRSAPSEHGRVLHGPYVPIPAPGPASPGHKAGKPRSRPRQRHRLDGAAQIHPQIVHADGDHRHRGTGTPAGTRETSGATRAATGTPEPAAPAELIRQDAARRRKRRGREIVACGEYFPVADMARIGARAGNVGRDDLARSCQDRPAPKACPRPIAPTHSATSAPLPVWRLAADLHPKNQEIPTHARCARSR